MITYEMNAEVSFNLISDDEHKFHTLEILVAQNTDTACLTAIEINSIILEDIEEMIDELEAIRDELVKNGN